MSPFWANSTRCSANSPGIYYEDFYPIVPKCKKKGNLSCQKHTQALHAYVCPLGPVLSELIRLGQHLFNIIHPVHYLNQKHTV